MKRWIGCNEMNELWFSMIYIYNNTVLADWIANQVCIYVRMQVSKQEQGFRFRCEFELEFPVD